jgi:hypothetical protein
VIEEIALDKARIVREAVADWKVASASWSWLVACEGFLWVEPEDLAIDWLGSRLKDAFGWEEARLRREAKQYLSRWALNQKNRIGAEAAESAKPVAHEWDGMLDEFHEADRMTVGAINKMVGVQNTPTVQRSTRLPHGEYGLIPSEYWGDYWLSVAHDPSLLTLGRKPRIHKMSSAAREQKHSAEGPPLKKDRHGRFQQAISLDRAVGDATLADALDPSIAVSEEGMWSTVTR